MSSADRNLPEDADEGKLPVTSRADQTRNRRLVKKEPLDAERLSPEQRLLLLDTWRRSGLPARDFAALVGVSRHTLYSWKKKFDAEGPAGLVDKPRGGPTGSRLPELTRRAILMVGAAHPTGRWPARGGLRAGGDADPQIMSARSSAPGPQR